MSCKLGMAEKNCGSMYEIGLDETSLYNNRSIMIQRTEKRLSQTIG